MSASMPVLSCPPLLHRLAALIRRLCARIVCMPRVAEMQAARYEVSIPKEDNSMVVVSLDGS